MATMVNGAPIEWEGYQYARVHRGKIVETGNLDCLKARKKALGLPGKIRFRALYVTEWWPVSETSKA